jgi:hypothetical protein
MTRLGIDHGALPAPLWNGLHFHVACGTHFLKCSFSRPQSGRCLYYSKTGSRKANRFRYFRAELLRPWLLQVSLPSDTCACKSYYPCVNSEE